jgi:hypothetical protein
MKENYEVGYGKPPKATRFGNRPQPDRSSKSEPATADALDVAGILDRPVKIRRGGREVSMHPHEAMLFALAQSGLNNGKIGAIREFFRECQKAGLLAARPTQPITGVIIAPKGVPIDLAARLVRTAGPPPWDVDLLEEYRAEYERDCEHIERLAELEKARQNEKAK